MVTPEDSSTFWAAAPQGTSGAQTTTLVPGSARSCRDATPAGLSGGTAISKVLDANFTGVPRTSSSATALSMFAVSADANTSAGAPCWICATRSEEPPKLKLTFTPVCEASNRFPSSVNVDVSDDAAKTVSVVPWEASEAPSEL